MAIICRYVYIYVRIYIYKYIYVCIYIFVYNNNIIIMLVCITYYIPDWRVTIIGIHVPTDVQNMHT